MRLHDNYVTSAGIPQRSSGRLTLHDGNAEDRAVLLAQRGERHMRRFLGIHRVLFSVDCPYRRSSTPVYQAGGGSSTRSNTRPLEPSPRPMGDSRPIQRNVVPSVQRARRKPRVTRRPARGTSSSATVPVEHERLPVADSLVLVISLLGSPEIAEKTSHLKADAVREPKRFTMATRRGRAARSERRRISTNPVRSRWCGHRARG